MGFFGPIVGPGGMHEGATPPLTFGFFRALRVRSKCTFISSITMQSKGTPASPASAPASAPPPAGRRGRAMRCHLQVKSRCEGMTARYGGAQHSTLPTLHSGSRHGHSCGSSADICASQPACKLVPSNIKCCTVPNKLSRRNFGWQFPSMKIRTRRTGDPWNGSC